MKNTTILHLLILCSLAAQAQTDLAQSYAAHLQKTISSLKDSTHLYVGDGEETDLFYYTLVPENPIKGTLILMPPTGQSVETVINHNIPLAQLAFDNNFLLLIPSMNYNLCLDEVAMRFINNTFTEVLKKHNPPKDKIIIGGFSLGGMNAIRYTEMAYEDPSTTVFRPLAVYGVDPPLDWKNTFYTNERCMKKDFSEVAVNEATYYNRLLMSRFGGSPVEVPDVYVKYSMYSRDKKYGGNTRYLKEVPVRIYSDPDISWHLENRQSDFYDLNALDQAAMINQLQQMGNTKAEYINALGKGYRLDGKRHPHSWSLVDPDECMTWMLDLVENHKLPPLPKVNTKKNKSQLKNIKPLLIDRATLSGENLNKVRNPNDPDRRLFQRRLFRGEEISVYIVSSETATAAQNNYGIDEFIGVINGRARLNPAKGEERFFTHGDFFVAPKGFTGDWETQGAEEFYHEISVITTDRGPEADSNSNNILPIQIDKDKLSGIGMTKVKTLDGKLKYQDILYKGLELKVILNAEESSTKEINENLEEQLIYLISGTLTLTPTNKDDQIFYAGDYLVLPKNFSGHWETKGHGPTRWLSIQKNK